MPDRIIRESICTSETLNLLSDFEERFWHHLIVVCDDFGRFDARPAVLKARLFPLRESLTYKNVADCLARLASAGLIELYEVDGRPFLRVVTWERYQRRRANRSKFPAPEDGRRTAAAEIQAHDVTPRTSDNTCCQLTANVPEYESEYECDKREAKCEDENDARARASVAVVMSAYLNKINAAPSQTSLDELKGYVEEMGPDCCLRAFDIALDAKKASWNYIRGILRRKLSQGVRCLADWDALEEKRGGAERRRDGKPGSDSVCGADGGQYTVRPDLEL